MQTNPMVGLWLARERVKMLQAEAGGGRAELRARSRERRRRGGMRFAIGRRLVSAGSRLLGGTAVVTLHVEGR